MKHREKGWGWPACPLSVPWKLCNDASPAPSHSPSTHSPLHTLWNYFAKSEKCLKWFVFFDINSFWKIHMYSEQFQMLLTTSLHYFCSAITSLNSVGWLVHTVKGPLPENRVFTLHYPTSIQASQTFSHHLSSFVHNTGHSFLDPAPMPPWSLKSLSPLPCAPFCPPTTHCQGTANSVSPYAGPGVHVSTVFYNYQFFFSAKRTILHIHRLPSKRGYCFFFFLLLLDLVCRVWEWRYVGATSWQKPELQLENPQRSRGRWGGRAVSHTDLAEPSGSLSGACVRLPWFEDIDGL